MKIFITGVTGYLGSHVASALLKNGHHVTGLVRKEEQVKNVERIGIQPLLGDISDTALLYEKGKTHDAIVHAASGQGEKWSKLNHQALTAMLSALENTSKSFLIQNGTMLFGDTKDNIVSDKNVYYNPPNPLKELAKVAEYIFSFQDKGVRPIIISASFVYGGKGAAIPNIMKAKAIEKGQSAYLGTGENKWSSVHIKDWSNLFVKAIESKSAIGNYIASTNIYSIKQYAEFINQALNLATNVVSLDPKGHEKYWAFFTPALAFMNQRFLSERAKEELNWKPQIKDIIQHL